METILHILALLLVSVAMALSLAHALELPGKKRLDKDTYIACQEIYYPGFAAGVWLAMLGARWRSPFSFSFCPMAPPVSGGARSRWRASSQSTGFTGPSPIR